MTKARITLSFFPYVQQGGNVMRSWNEIINQAACTNSKSTILRSRDHLSSPQRRLMRQGYHLCYPCSLKQLGASSAVRGTSRRNHP